MQRVRQGSQDRWDSNAVSLRLYLLPLLSPLQAWATGVAKGFGMRLLWVALVCLLGAGFIAYCLWATSQGAMEPEDEE